MDNKKNTLTYVLVIIIIIVLIGIVVIKNNNQPKEVEPINQQETELNNAVKSDSTKSITDSINNINVDDTSVKELQPVDQELKVL